MAGSNQTGDQLHRFCLFILQSVPGLVLVGGVEGRKSQTNPGLMASKMSSSGRRRKGRHTLEVILNLVAWARGRTPPFVVRALSTRSDSCANPIALLGYVLSSQLGLRSIKFFSDWNRSRLNEWSVQAVPERPQAMNMLAMDGLNCSNTHSESIVQENISIINFGFYSGFSIQDLTKILWDSSARVEVRLNTISHLPIEVMVLNIKIQFERAHWKTFNLPSSFTNKNWHFFQKGKKCLNSNNQKEMLFLKASQ